jgi:hypothetical protein
MKNRIIVIAFCGLLATTNNLRAEEATFFVVPLSPLNIAQGESFHFQVNLQTDAPSVGAGFYFNEATSSGFSILSIDRSATPFTDTVFSSSEITSQIGGNHLLNARNDSNLGGLVANLFAPMPSGNYNLGQFTLSSNGVQPGSYTIDIGPVANLEVLNSALGNFQSIGATGFNVTVTSVPEPSSLILLLAACTGVTCWIRRTV